MANIVQVQLTGAGTPVNHNRTTLTGTDTLTYVSGGKQSLLLYNTTASPITVTITGANATTIFPQGAGAPIPVSGGKAITVPANDSTSVLLDTIAAFLVGPITLTGGLGLVAHLST